MLQEINIGEEPLDLDATFTSGQIFRWHKIDGWWQGWIGHSKVAFKKTDNLIQFRSVPTLNPDVIRNFFSLQVDHKSINESLPDDRFTKYLVKKYSGIRILQQDTWECAMAYIISSSLNINVINKILDRISLLFTGDSRGRLPRPHELQMIKRPLNNFLGKKWDYLSILSKQIVEGTFKFELLQALTYESAWRRLVIEEPHFKGIGPKVADCILLFSTNKYSSFPIDRWVFRGLKKYYSSLVEESGVSSEHLTVTQYKKLSDLARQHFGKFSGFLQEYLFVHLRNTNLF
jgi:N-glycosylase/DNA lyase